VSIALESRLSGSTLALGLFAAFGCAGASVGPSTPREFAEVPPVVTLTATGASPQVLHIYARDGASFVNSDARRHVVESDVTLNPDPGCAGVGVGELLPGESRKTPVLPSGIPCFYRDALDPTNEAYRGFVLTHY
jgi:hypothetical protein